MLINISPFHSVYISLFFVFFKYSTVFWGAYKWLGGNFLLVSHIQKCPAYVIMKESSWALVFVRIDGYLP